MSRNRVDLRRLPGWLQVTIALAVVAVVGTAAWLSRGGRPAPAWVMHYLVPALGVLYIVLVCLAIVGWLLDRKERRA